MRALCGGSVAFFPVVAQYIPSTAASALAGTGRFPPPRLFSIIAVEDLAPFNQQLSFGNPLAPIK
jgi:hypothetical protein